MVYMNQSLAFFSVKTLGIFHGTGFALKYKNPADFKRLTQSLREPRYDITEMHPLWEMITKFGAERLGISTRKYQPQIEESFISRYCKIISDFVAFGRKMVAPVEPLATLCHGDYLRNNIAFKYAEVDVSMRNDTSMVSICIAIFLQSAEKPIEALMFDMQTMRVSSPMLDFATFLSLSTYAAVRCKHFDEIFEEYYTNLVRAFKEHTNEEQIPEYLRYTLHYILDR